MGAPATGDLAVLRVYHSGVVSDWRARDRALREMGVDVTLVSPQRWNEGGARVDLEADGDDFVVSARTFGSHPYRFAYDPRPLRRLLRSERFDIVDVHEEPGSLAAFEVSLLVRLYNRHAKLMFYSAQNLDKRLPPPFQWLRSLALRQAAAIYCVNQAAGSLMRSRGFAGIMAVLGLGFDPAQFKPVPDAGGRVVPLRAGYIGRLEQRKGVFVLLDALAARVKDVTLVVAGDGPARASLEDRVASLGLADRVEFVGFVAHDDLPAIYRQLDVVVVPSLPTSGWVEQFCRVAVEAMACGVPVVASDSGALPEVVGDGGVLVPAGDVHALSDALQRLVDDPTLRQTLSRLGRDHARRFSWAEIAAAHRQLYLQVRS